MSVFSRYLGKYFYAKAGHSMSVVDFGKRYWRYKLLTKNEITKFVAKFIQQNPKVRKVIIAMDDEDEDNCTVELEWPEGNVLAKMYVGGDVDEGHQVVLELESVLPDNKITVVYS